MKSRDTIHKDRINKALSFEKPDRPPRDFAAVPEIWNCKSSKTLGPKIRFY
jgi:hypothetical protein